MRLTWTELMDCPSEPPPQLRPGIPEIGVTVLAGSPKVGKTLWASQVALELRKPTLFVVEEGSLNGISYRMRHQADRLGITEPPPVEVWHREGVQLDRPANLKRLSERASTLNPALVVLDPLNRLHSADENRPSQMTRVMEALAELAYSNACAVLAIHHLSKPSAERRGDIWDRLRGAGSIRSGTDSNLAMDAAGTRVRLVGEFRDAEPLSQWLELDRDSLLFSGAEAPEAPAKVNPVLLGEFLERRGDVTAAQVMKEFDVSRHTALDALRALRCDEWEGSRRQLHFSLRTASG